MSGMILQGLGIDITILQTGTVNVVLPGQIVQTQVGAEIQPKPITGEISSVQLQSEVL